MALHLFPHNKQAYEAAMGLMDEEGKGAVIHPTGTGKYFIAFQLAAEHSTDRILWLARRSDCKENPSCANVCDFHVCLSRRIKKAAKRVENTLCSVLVKNT